VVRQAVLLLVLLLVVVVVVIVVVAGGVWRRPALPLPHQLLPLLVASGGVKASNPDSTRHL